MLAALEQDTEKFRGKVVIIRCDYYRHHQQQQQQSSSLPSTSAAGSCNHALLRFHHVLVHACSV
jgi:hypothetical protein